MTVFNFVQISHLTERSMVKGEFFGRGGEQREILPLVNHLPMLMSPEEGPRLGVHLPFPTLLSKPVQFSTGTPASMLGQHPERGF